MRRPTSALTAALAAIGLSAPLAGAQQSFPTSNPPASPASAVAVDPAMAGRPARYLLRNGMDYLAYREYSRALNFLRAVEARQNELNESERKSLKQAIARAQDGLREAVNAPRLASAPAKGRPKTQPGAFALAQPAAQAPASPAPAADEVQLTAATMEMAAAAPVPAPLPEATAPTAPVFGGEAASLPSLPPATPHALGDGAAMPALPGEAPAPAPPPEPLGEFAAPVAASPAPAELPPAELPPATPTGLQPATPPPIGLDSIPETAPAATELPAAVPAMPEMPAAAPAMPELPGAEPAPLNDSATAPTLALPPADEPSSALPALPEEPATPPALPIAASEPTPAPVPVPVPAYEAMPSAPVEPAPPPEASPMPRSAELSASEPPRAIQGLDQPPPPTILSPKLREEVERIAQRQPDEDRQLVDRQQSAIPTDPTAPMQPIQGSTRLDLPRAPSPTEARPLRRIPVPEDFVPLGAREWDPNRKYWAAAATCHMPLYFQDAVLERYGQSAEQALGPNGRFFSYPLDDPKQSNQRNQILQPFASIGIFCFQIGTWPYKLIVDPPWEAEYDLGYYRPGDRIPADTIYATPTGLGPPGHGRKY